MTVAISAVPKWLILSGKIGHVLAMTKHGWHFTACGTYTPNGKIMSKKPDRVCRACREKLSQAWVKV